MGKLSFLTYALQQFQVPTFPLHQYKSVIKTHLRSNNNKYVRKHDDSATHRHGGGIEMPAIRGEHNHRRPGFHLKFKCIVPDTE